MRRRVVITGVGAVTPYGYGVDTMMDGLSSGVCALSLIPASQKIDSIDCHVAGLVPQLGGRIPREIRRSMSPMSVYAWFAASEALKMAGVIDTADIGACIGSTLGSSQEIGDIYSELHKFGKLDQIRSMAFFKIMGHSAASNLAVSLKLGGRVISPTAACATGLHAIGIAYEMIAFGRSDKLLAGGTEEFSFLAPATFDKICVGSHEVDPECACRPFDVRRTGVICGEGAGVLYLEEMENARARGATILGEIKGFATLASNNLAILDEKFAEKSMRMALKDADLQPGQVAYVNAHATGTAIGDMAEGKAIEAVFGKTVSVSSLKSYMGHTLAASGAIESVACVKMMNRKSLLGQPSDFILDGKCGKICYAKTAAPLEKGALLKNSFALGGIYASLVFTSIE